MSEFNYKPNSHKSKEEQKTEEKRVTQSIKGNVKTKKKGEMHKLADVFISEDIHNVKSFLFTDVLVPNIKRIIVDMVGDGINMLVYGSRRNGNSNRADKASWIDYSKRSTDDRRPATSQWSRSNFSSDDFTFESRADAEEVLSVMDGLIERYGVVRVLDLYDIVGKTCDHTANRYGWTSIRSAEVVRARDGYVIKMPRPLPID